MATLPGSLPGPSPSLSFQGKAGLLSLGRRSLRAGSIWPGPRCPPKGQLGGILFFGAGELDHHVALRPIRAVW